MKFRARIAEQNHIRQFAQLMHILSKCCKQFQIGIYTDKLKFVVLERDARIRNHGATAFCTFPVRPYFPEYQMDGINDQYNEIHLEIPSDAIAGVLSNFRGNASSVASLKIKLTKKHVPCITIEIELITESVSSVQTCTHDIPVTILNKRNWPEYEQPNFVSNISLLMPELKMFQRSLDRMKNLAQKLRFRANKRTGNFFLSIETLAVNSTVTFKDPLVILASDEEEEAETAEMMETDSQNDADDICVEVDMKSLMQLIPQESIKPNSYSLSIAHERMLHLEYVYGEINLHYMLPGM